MVGENLSAGIATFAIEDANGCTIEGSIYLETSLEEDVMHGVVIFYHTATQAVNIKYPHDGSKSISIFDSSGRLVLTESFAGRNHSIPVSFLAVGVYNTHLVGNDEISIQKFLRE